MFLPIEIFELHCISTINIRWHIFDFTTPFAYPRIRPYLKNIRRWSLNTFQNEIPQKNSSTKKRLKI
jgi:hypothetical protein